MRYVIENAFLLGKVCHVRIIARAAISIRIDCLLSMINIRILNFLKKNKKSIFLHVNNAK